MAVTDLPPLLPVSAKVVFPRTDDAALSASVHVVTVTLASLALAEFSGALTHTGSKVLRSSCIAAFTAAGGGTPTNNTELNALATQMATDWYRWQLSKASLAFAGNVPWVIDGLSDAVEWTWETPFARTRILKPSFNDYGNAYTSIYGSGGSANNVVNNLSITNNLFVGGKIINFVNVTLGTSQNNYVFTNNNLNITPTANINITGLASTGAKIGESVTITNVSDAFTISFPHQSGSSSAGNQFNNPTLTTIVLGPQEQITFVWNGSFWEPKLTPVKTQPATPAQVTATQTTYALAYGWENVYLNTDAAGYLFRGFSGGYNGRRIYVYNNGSFSFIIPHQDGAATAAERIITPNGQNYTLQPQTGVWLQYDSAVSRWRLESQNPMSALGDIIYGGTSGIQTKLAGNTTTTQKVLAQTGDGSNSAAPSWEVLSASSQSPQWVKVTKTFADYSVAATGTQIVVRSMAAKEVLHAVVIRPTTAFSGGSITSYTVGLQTAIGSVAAAFDVFQPTGDTVFFFEDGQSGLGPQNFGAAADLISEAQASHNLNTATAGVVEFYLLISTLP